MNSDKISWLLFVVFFGFQEFWPNSDLNSSFGSVPRRPNLSTQVGTVGQAATNITQKVLLFDRAEMKWQWLAQQLKTFMEAGQVSGCRFWSQHISSYFNLFYFAEGQNTKVSAKYQNTDVFWCFQFDDGKIREIPRMTSEQNIMQIKQKKLQKVFNLSEK